MKIEDLQPIEVWKYFHEITQVPRPSKKEEKMVKYLEDFAKEHKLEYVKDRANNILIRKGATKGKEHLPTTILQSHVDMVCEKNKETIHDFENDPIETRIEGDWVKANGTTLGADDGIGVAAQLAILASSTIEHGKIECLFTTDEETGLSGAFALDKDLLSGTVLINLDTEEEGQFYIGCAGGKDTSATFTYNSQAVPADYFWFKVQVKGLQGGHSGSEIHLGLGNANKILNRYLHALNTNYSLYIAEIDGGNLRNAIAREAFAIVGIPAADKELAAISMNLLSAQVEDELKVADPKVKLSLESVEAPQVCIEKEVSDKLIHALYACPHGVIGMSSDIPGLVETSTNLASVKMPQANTILVGTSQRSSTNSLKVDVGDMVKSVFTLAGAEVKSSDGYPGWKPNPNSKILTASEEVYERLFGKKPEIKAIHAGLECGLFLEKYPELDMISCGPTILGAHSPDERIQISTVEKWWVFLLELLKNIPVK